MDALRTALQPITHNLPAPVRDLGVSLLGPQCYKTLLLDIDPSSLECLKLAISKGLGIGIIGASATVKIPQILKLINSKSPAGVSFLSYLLETAAFLINLAYNYRSGFPFTTYGETALIMAQNVVVAVLVLNYSGKASTAALFVAGLTTSLVTLFSKDMVDMKTLTYLSGVAGLLGVGSKVPQIAAIWKEGGTGQLSAFAVFNYVAGSLARVFTTVQEVNDPMMLYPTIAAFVLNLVIALQMVYYWNAPSKKTKAKGKQRETPIAAAVAQSSAVPNKARTPTTRRRG